MSSSSPPKPRIQRDRDRLDFEQLERASQDNLRDRDRDQDRHRDRNRDGDEDDRDRLPSAATVTGTIIVGPLRAPHRRSGSKGSLSTSSNSKSSSTSPVTGPLPLALALPSTSTSNALPTRAVALPTALAVSGYPNYYDYAENLNDNLTLKADAGLASSQQPTRHKTVPSTMAMQVPTHPQQQQQQPPPQRLADNGTRSSYAPRQHSSSSSPHDNIINNHNNGNTIAATNNNTANGSNGAKPRRPSIATRDSKLSSLNSPVDDVFPPNKVDLDAARYRHQQQQQSRRDREPHDRPQPTAKDRRPSQQSNGARPAVNGNHAMGPSHHLSNGGARSASPSSPLGPQIHRLPTPSVPNSVLQPLDAKVVEYGSLMADAQEDINRLDEEMRQLQDRQHEAETRYHEAKAKHDEYRRQYSDVDRALRGEFAAAMHQRGGGGSHRNLHSDHNGANGYVPPVPSMPSLQQYGVAQSPGAGGSGRENGTGSRAMSPPATNGVLPSRNQRTVSIQGDAMSQNSERMSKRARFSRLFGI